MPSNVPRRDYQIPKSNVPGGGRMGINPPRFGGPTPNKGGDIELPNKPGGGTVNINPPGKMPIPNKGGKKIAAWELKKRSVRDSKRDAIDGLKRSTAVPSFFSDLFSGTVKPKRRRDEDSTYRSQVPKAADSPAPPPKPKPKPRAEGSDSSGTGSTGPNDPNEGSTYHSQVPMEASLPGHARPPISLGPTGQTNSGTTQNPSTGSNGSGGANSGTPGNPAAPPPDVATPAPPAAPAPAAPAPKPPPPPPPPQEWEVLSIPDAESNAQYVARQAALQKTLEGYIDQDKTARQSKMKATDRSLTDLGWTDPDKYAGKKEGKWDSRGEGSFGRSFVANEGDFAGRGLGRGGSYLKAQKRLLNDYNERRDLIGDEQQDWTQAQDVALDNKRDENSAFEASNKADTIAAIAQNLGVDADMILGGFGTGEDVRYKRRVDAGAKEDERKYVRTSAKKGSDLNKRAKINAAKKAAAKRAADKAKEGK